MALFKGSGVAIITPFKSDSSRKVDFDKYEELIDWHVKNGTDAIITCGTTGETSTMLIDEQLEVIECAVSAAKKRIPVIAGTGTNDTAYDINVSKGAEKLGVDGLLLVTPYYNKTSQKGLIQHFNALATSVSIPVILYNVPSRTALNILPDTVKELSKIENIVGIKEASGDISQIAAIAEFCDDNFSLYSGNDDQTIPILALGGIGLISVVANIMPQYVHDMIFTYLEGSHDKARDMQLKLNPLCRALFLDVSPMPLKSAMNMMDMEVGECRLPLIGIEDSVKEMLKKRMTEHGLV
ncbi:MAG: 4-hydroxy-tetrahydrodipicolinate synthase [Defluviitaleaceae bacterium]|nr:4-hydroxy-tetrahydrodipicolinate synthase [Defluviitaleaceae bacterium]